MRLIESSRDSPPQAGASASVSFTNESSSSTSSPGRHGKNRLDDNRSSAALHQQQTPPPPRTVKARVRDSEWLWLNACHGVVDGDVHAVESYLAAGGDVSRQLTADECHVLKRPSAFEPGHTLVHLAIRFQREDFLEILLTAADVANKAKKRMPCHVAPDIASDITRDVSASIRQRKGDFPCYFLSEINTFMLPAGGSRLYIIIIKL